jgi:hypothetical protein
VGTDVHRFQPPRHEIPENLTLAEPRRRMRHDVDDLEAHAHAIERFQLNVRM